MKRTVIALFTGTGNTLYVAGFFKDAEIHFIDKILDGSDSLPSDIDRLGIMFPVYFAGIPYPVRVFIEDYLSSRDNSDIGYIFALTTNGGGPYAHLYSFDKLLQKIGLNLSYAATIRMPDGYMKQKQKQLSEMEALAFANKMKRKTDKIIEEITAEEIKLPKGLPFARTVGAISKRRNNPGKDNMLTLDESKCTSCRICSHICPMDNIKIENETIEYDGKCISCYACYHRCPENALSFKGLKDQYKGLQDTSELWRR